jgi:hypothetical protein
MDSVAAARSLQSVSRKARIRLRSKRLTAGWSKSDEGCYGKACGTSGKDSGCACPGQIQNAHGVAHDADLCFLPLNRARLERFGIRFALRRADRRDAQIERKRAVVAETIRALGSIELTGPNGKGSVHKGIIGKIQQNLSPMRKSCVEMNKALRACARKALIFLVGARGFEPPTTCTPCRYATRLRYAPKESKSISDTLPF